jgi:hypothetical protein
MEIERLPLGQSLADKHRAAALKWRGKPPGIPPDLAVEFMAKLKAGSTIRKLTGGGVLGPAIVTLDRFKKHCELNPEWGDEARRISDVNSRALKGSRERSKTHCKNGHPFAGDNLYVPPGGRERRCWACMRHNAKFGRRVSEEQARRVVDALRHGETIATITKNGSPAYVLTNRALFLFRQRNPQFGRLVVRLSTANAKVHHAEASAKRARIARAPAIAANAPDIFKLIRDEVPTTLPAQIRDDVIGTMAMEIVEGKLRPTDVRRRVKEYITAQYRQFSSYGPRSLDTALSADGPATLLDMLSTDAGTGYWDPNMMASNGHRK